MQGAGLPVCALSYPCLAREMVEDGRTGLLFSTPHQLAGQVGGAGQRGGGFVAPNARPTTTPAHPPTHPRHPPTHPL